MIEEIKKEINKLPLYSKSVPRPTVDYLDVIEILDKYNNQPDYKSAWEELPKMFVGTANLGKLETCMEELEQKYKLGGE